MESSASKATDKTRAKVGERLPVSAMSGARYDNEDRVTIRVLCVDDDDMDFLAVKRALKLSRTAEYECIHAVSIDEAIKCMEQESFDVALIDYYLGPACGLDLVRRYGGRHGPMPFIVLTGAHDAHVAADVVDSGVTDYIEKQAIDENLLTAAIDQAIQRHGQEKDLLKKAGHVLDNSFRIPGLGYWDYNLASADVVWSRESYLIWGRVPGDFEPKLQNLLDLVYEEDRGRFLLTFEEDATASSQEFRIVLTDGSIRNVYSIISRLFDNEGNLKRVSGIYQDVTARRQNEDRLLAQKRKYERLFEHSDVALFSVNVCSLVETALEVRADVSSAEKLAELLNNDPCELQAVLARIGINDVNGAGVNLLGARSKSIIYEPVFRQQVWFINLAARLLSACAHDEPFLRFESTITRSDNSKVPVIISVPVPDNAKDGEAVLITIVDISATREAEHEKQANEAKSIFLAKMSHEIRTPLNAIVANLELLNGTMMSDEQVRMVEDAHSASELLLQLIGDILDFSKIEADKLELASEPTSIDGLVRTLESILQSRAKQFGIFFTASISNSVPYLVESDTLRLKQILLNLVSNAIKFTRDGGVFLEVYSEKLEEEACVLRFRVHDSGQGLDRTRDGHIFGAFAQAEKSINQHIQGTGLGLSICKALVEHAGGEINFDGAPGKGTTFWFTWPVKVLEAARTPQSPDLTKYTSIAIIDELRSDHATVAALRERGRTIIEVSDELAAADEVLKLGEKQREVPVYYEQRKGHLLGPELCDALKATDHFCIVSLAENELEHYWYFLRHGFRRLLRPDESILTMDRNFERYLSKTDISGAVPTGLFEPRDEGSYKELLSGLRVLVLEDQPLNQQVILRQAERLGLDVDLGADGYEGQQLITQNAYDCVLCDCSMPRMDGYEFTRSVRRLRDTGKSTTPIVALTANAFVEDVEKCYAAGMDEFLSKPVKIDHLASCLIRLTKDKKRKTQDPKEGVDAALEASDSERDSVDNDASGERSAPVNLAILQNLLGTDDPDLLVHMLKSFLSESSKSIMRVLNAIAARDAKELKAAAHAAKGDARSAGATELAQTYEQIERNALEENWDSLNELVSSAERSCNLVTQFISDKLIPMLKSSVHDTQEAANDR